MIALFAVSCQKDDDNFAAENGSNQSELVIPELKNGEVAFAASGEGSVKKAHYKSDDDHTILWDGNEEFSVFPVGKTTNEKFATSSEYAGKGSCIIKGTPTETSDEYFALYPYTSAAKYADGKFTNVVMPSSQTVTKGQYDTKADIMVGYANSIDLKMTLRHVGSKLGIKVPADAGDVKSIKITCSEYIAGTVSVALASGASSEPVATVTGGSKTIVMRSESGFEAGETYYVCVLPTSKESTIKVTFFTDDAQTVGKYSSATVPAIVRNTKISATPLAKHDFGIVTVTMSELNPSSNFPSSATKIVFDYLHKVDVSDFGEPISTLKAGDIKIYQNETEYYILSDKEICMSGSLSKMFYRYYSLKELEFNNFNTESITNTAYMFYECEALTSLDLSNFNTGNVTNMTYTFFSCKALTNLNVSNFDTKNVNNISGLFCDCKALTSIDVSNFNTRNASDMSSMFSGCKALTSLDLSNFNTGNVSDMSSMFYDCNALTSLDVSNFNTERVVKMNKLFYDCNALTSLDISNFNTIMVEDMASMFYKCNGLTSLDLSNFRTAKVTKMSNMFESCLNLTTIYANKRFSTSKVTSSSGMFTDCSQLVGSNKTTYNSSYTDKTYAHVDEPGNPGYFTYKAPSTGDETEIVFVKLSDLNKSANFPSTAIKIVFDYLSNVDVSAFGDPTILMNGDIKIYNNGTEYYILSDKEICMEGSLNYMFGEYSSLQELVFNNFNTIFVTDMSYMFYKCQALTSLDLSKFNTVNVTNMSSMFWECNVLTSIDVSKFNTKNVTDMSNMFSNCKALASLDVSNFNTENVVNMNQLFYHCDVLPSLNVSNFNTENVTGMSAMFGYCQALTSLDLSNFNTGKVKTMSSMFSSCGNLTKIYANDNFNTSNVTSGSYMFSGCKKLVGGNGSTFSYSSVESYYARVDKPGQRGYFTYRAPSASAK